MKNIVKILILAAMMAGCAKIEPSPDTPTSQEAPHAVTLPLSILSQPAYDSETEPMTRADDNIKLGPLQNKYQYVICKKVGSVWYVDDIGEALLMKDKGVFYDFDAKKSDIYNDLELELRPGDYHIVVATNPRFVKWNAELTKGTPVKNDEGTIQSPWMFQYSRGTDDWRPNYGIIGLNRDIITGTADFTVTKTGDLHSSGSGEPVKIAMTRINCWYRLLLRDDPTLPEHVKFVMNTANTSNIFLESLDEKGFPYGVDAWGDAWYPVPAETKLHIYSSSGFAGYTGKDGILYSIFMPNATYFYPMIIADKNRPEGHQYKINKIIITGQAGHLATYFIDNVKERVYHANTYSCVVLEATEEIRQVDPDISEPAVIAREGAAPDDPYALFDEYYEWNN